jgi:hypothetical protein
VTPRLPRAASRGRPLAALLLAAALAACGGDAPPKAAPSAPVRVEIVYASVDAGGPVDGFSLVGEDGKTWPLASQPALDRRVLAADAPGGRYRVTGPAGWGAVGPLEPLALRGDVPPSPLWVGRTHSVYLVHPPELPVEQVDVRTEARETGPRALDARLETGADGRSVLRIPPAQWSGTFRLQVRLGKTHFSKAIRVNLLGDGAPVHAVTEPELMTTFDVLALPADGVPVAGLEVTAVSKMGSLEARVTAKTNASGWARLDPIPVAADGFALTMEVRESSGFADLVRWDGASLRHHGEARLLAPTRGAWVEFHLRSSTVQVRSEASDTYVLVPNSHPAALPPGRYRSIVTHPDGPTFADPFEVSPGDTNVSLDARREAPCTLTVHIRGGFATKQDRYDLHARRIEDGKEVSLVGGTLRNLLRRDADLALPPGKYRVRLAHGAKESAPKDVDLSTPGTRASIELDAPR